MAFALLARFVIKNLCWYAFYTVFPSNTFIFPYINKSYSCLSIVVHTEFSIIGAIILQGTQLFAPRSSIVTVFGTGICSGAACAVEKDNIKIKIISEYLSIVTPNGQNIAKIVCTARKSYFVNNSGCDKGILITKSANSSRTRLYCAKASSSFCAVSASLGGSSKPWCSTFALPGKCGQASAASPQSVTTRSNVIGGKSRRFLGRYVEMITPFSAIACTAK